MSAVWQTAPRFANTQARGRAMTLTDRYGPSSAHDSQGGARMAQYPGDIDTMVYVNGDLVRKSEAVISIYDSGFCHGDGAYEGIRLYEGRVFRLDAHIRRMFEALKMLDIDPGVDEDGMREIVLDTFRANEHRTDLHMRLQVTRGRKRVTGMNPKMNIGPIALWRLST